MKITTHVSSQLLSSYTFVRKKRDRWRTPASKRKQKSLPSLCFGNASSPSLQTLSSICIRAPPRLLLSAFLFPQSVHLPHYSPPVISLLHINGTGNKVLRKLLSFYVLNVLWSLTQQIQQGFQQDVFLCDALKNKCSRDFLQLWCISESCTTGGSCSWPSINVVFCQSACFPNLYGGDD